MSHTAKRLDHIADTAGQELYRLSQLYEFPDFVKKANMEVVFNKTPVSVHLYADPINKQFPCDTAVNTWLSALYFAEKRAEYHPKDQTRIEHRLSHYTDYWKI